MGGIAPGSAAQNLEASTDAAGLSLDIEGRTLVPLCEFQVSRNDNATASALEDPGFRMSLTIGIASDSPELEEEINSRREDLRAAAASVLSENRWSESESVASRIAVRTALQK